MSHDHRWHVVSLESRDLWLPGPAWEHLVSTGDFRQVGPREIYWEAGALVPTDRWAVLAGTVHRRAATVAAFRSGHDVALIPLPDGVQRLTPDAQLMILGDCDKYIGELQHPGGWPTLTIDPSTNLRLGLHLDNWDRLPTAERARSRNRASVNLGPASRAFLFVDFDVIAAYKPQVVPHTGSVREVLLRERVAPAVIRLRVPPGWAYIAPTESVVHDGSSSGCNGTARYAAALGAFTPRFDGAGVTDSTLGRSTSIGPAASGPARAGTAVVL